MARSQTQRGFAVYDQFTDHYGHEVRVQQSSLATGDCVWIFCSVDGERMAPHLTVEQAARVRDALGVFVREHTQTPGTEGVPGRPKEQDMPETDEITEAPVTDDGETVALTGEAGDGEAGESEADEDADADTDTDTDGE